MDKADLLAAVRYVVMNPVEARLAAKAADWPWSSARVHLSGRDDVLVKLAPVRDRVPDLATFLDEEPDPDMRGRLLAGPTIGCPLMPDEQIQVLEQA